MTTTCTPVVAAMTVVTSATTTVAVTADEPVFAGHYPDFPIFPGVCLVECALRSIAATPPPVDRPLTLQQLESARFLGAVFPGDVLQVELAWKPMGTRWRCTATLRTTRGDAATIRLRYRDGGGS